MSELLKKSIAAAVKTALAQNLMYEDPDAPISQCLTPRQFHEIYLSLYPGPATAARRTPHLLARYFPPEYPRVKSNGTHFKGLVSAAPGPARKRSPETCSPKAREVTISTYLNTLSYKAAARAGADQRSRDNGYPESVTLPPLSYTTVRRFLQEAEIPTDTPRSPAIRKGHEARARKRARQEGYSRWDQVMEDPTAPWNQKSPRPPHSAGEGSPEQSS